MADQSESSVWAWGEIPFLRRAVKYGLGLVVLIFYATVLLHFRYTPDDTFIYLQFAKNILRGGGFAFNADEPTYGITSPLWTLIVAAGGWLKLDLYLVAKVLDLVFSSLALIIFYLLAIEIIRDRLVAFLATFVFSGNVWFIRWAASGMETSLSVLLLLVTVYYCLRNEYLLAALACAFLTLVRPEAALLFILLLLDMFLNAIEKRHAVKLAIGSGIIFAVIVGPWLVFAQKEFGTVIPNTATGKSGFGFSLQGIGATALDILKTLGTSNGLEFIFVLGLFGSIIKRGKFAELRYHFFPLAWIALLPLVYIGAEVDVVSRYLLLILPLVCLYGFYSLRKGLERIKVLSEYSLSVVLVVTTLLLIQNQYVYQKHVKPHMDRFAEGVEECLKPIAEWVRENTPPGTVVLSPDVGAIGYWSDRRLCDIAGLITPDMKRLRRQGFTYDEIMTNHLFIPFCYPEYVIDRAVVPERLADEQLTPLYTRRFNGLGLAKPETQFYTLYRLVPGVYPKTELTLAAATL